MLQYSNTPMLHARKSGQAMVELIVAMVALLALTGGLLLIVTFGSARTRAMTEARQEAGLQSMLDIPSVSAPEFIQDWDPGADGKDLTADDSAQMGNPGPFNDFIVGEAAADGDGWAVLGDASRTQLPDLDGHPDPVMALGMVEGEEHDSIPLLSVVQRLFYDADEINIEAKVWLTHTRGMY